MVKEEAEGYEQTLPPPSTSIRHLTLKMLITTIVAENYHRPSVANDGMYGLRDERKPLHPPFPDTEPYTVYASTWQSEGHGLLELNSAL